MQAAPVPASPPEATENTVESFEDLGIAPELTEVLAAEGIETPTPLQEEAIPVLRKGNHLVLAAGPGSGLLVSWAAALLDRIEAEGDKPRVLVLCTTTEIADRLAESVARLATATGHSVAALGASWVLPARAHVLFATAAEVLRGVGSHEVDLTELQAVVVDQAQLIESLGGLGEVEQVFDYLPEGTQRVLSALPTSAGIDDLVDRLFKRTMTLPSPETVAPPQRGAVRFRIAPEPREAATLAVIQDLLEDGARHALVFCRSEDRAADVGDYLTLHGFIAGAPGDTDVPVWLGVDALEARPAASDVEGLVVVSCDAPADPDTLDRRHSLSESGVVIVLPRELAHLKSLGKRTGYETVPFPPTPRGHDSITQLRAMVERAMETEDTAPYLLALEPLFERFDPGEVAAAALSLLRSKKGPSAGEATGSPARKSSAAQATATPSWAKLFIGVGERDGVRKGDVLGAIVGEAGVPADAVGKIEIRESHSLVEVHDSSARSVIQAINGTTIKGRAVRADFDRPRTTQKRPRR